MRQSLGGLIVTGSSANDHSRLLLSEILSPKAAIHFSAGYGQGWPVAECPVRSADMG